jgi:UBX domain-containing protein 1
LQGDANQSQGGGAGGDSDDSDDQDFFAGGEKSGLAVQNPGNGNAQDQINTLLDRARRNIGRPGGDDPQTTSHFRGTGQTLGGDDTPSQIIPDPNASIPPRAERVSRILHLWDDGFSVDDGELYRFDDPANQETLQLINSGRAPLDVLNVQNGQEVDLQVHQHRGETYKAPKKKYKPFSGGGQRLGSPVPSALSSSSAAPTAQSQADSSTSTTNASSAQAPSPSVPVDESQPTLTLQIRLGDGTRLQSRFNASHTIGDVYDFVDAASPASRQREYALMTTFPSTELQNKAEVLGDKAEFKRGGVVVQKWK